MIATACHPVSARYAQLRRVIDVSTGFAHATRGMNGDTINALRKAVTAADVATLVAMLDDGDHVTRLTAAFVLARLLPEGKAALAAELAKEEQRGVLKISRSGTRYDKP